MNDAKGIEIKVGDLILYGYGFYCAPLVGKVLAIYKNSVRYRYTYNIKCNNEIRKLESICKRPEYCLVCNHFREDPRTRELFYIDETESEN